MKVCDVVFRKDLYPRIEHNQAKVQEYSENIEHLPPIEVNQHNELIDGFHRLTAHKLAGVEEIKATVTETRSDAHFLVVAIQRNATHGLQLDQSDKRNMAIKFYSDETSWGEFSSANDRAKIKEDLCLLLKTSKAKLSEWLSGLDQVMRENRRKTIRKLWLQCYTAEEIGAEVGLLQPQVTAEVSSIFSDLKKSMKVTFSDESFQTPIYNVWAFGKKTNAVEHFGNTEQRIVDNLLWLYTEPGDIVIDPFGGGGATLDACVERGRRCWISDRKIKPGLEEKIRLLDICQDLPSLNKRWSDVSLTYLDPPYWRQAEGAYSTDAEDLANMPLDEFTASMAAIVKKIADKQSKGVIALIIQPTQWRSEIKGEFTDHVFDICAAVSKSKKLTLENRVSCPYQTEQCTPQMVEWAKENRKLLVLSRELILWKVVGAK